MARLGIRGKYIYAGGEKFFARGVSYGPFTPNSRGERYPEPDRVEADFKLMRELGANVVRTYVPPPPWMFELAAKHQLRLMVGMPWPFHMTFLDSAEMMREIRTTISNSVRAMKQYADAIFAYSLGNEIRSDIVRWHGSTRVNRFLRELYELGKQIDPEGLFTYSNYPSAEYLELNFLDFVSFNVYLHSEADFRRYLTHLLAATEDRPLVLSETGMDTIRQSEDHQAELLRWQSRAAFELGLSGFIIFAFTDEWHTGGAEITDWAFGLVTRERLPKAAFKAVGEVFHSELPPPLIEPPKASVVVCAYNAANTLGACLDSLKRLNYPEYEVIVVDDGSADATPRIAEDANIRVIRQPHRGLSAARNAGIAAATSQMVAFIDADAAADRDWLYHLVETIVRKDAVAAGGQNLAPGNLTGFKAAIAAAPGEPREVRASDDELDQVCGCSMLINISKLPDRAHFDDSFETAGDDVDFSWSLRERGLHLAYAPGATVIHHRRGTVRDYLRQQTGYGRAEAILARKYPNRSRGSGVYAGGGWFDRWFGRRPQVYYGLFGQGLFQSLYLSGGAPLALELPLDFSWLVVSILLLIIGLIVDPPIAIVGGLGLTAMVGAAIAMAQSRSTPHCHIRASRFSLTILCLLGPIWRNYARDFHFPGSWLKTTDDLPDRNWLLAWSGTIPMPSLHNEAGPDHVTFLTDSVRKTLLARGATVALTDGYQPYDLQVQTPDGVTANLNFLRNADGYALGWKIGVRQYTAIRRISGLIVSITLLLILGDRTVASVAAVAGIFVIGAIFLLDAYRIRPLLESAIADLTPPHHHPENQEHRS